MKRIFAAILMTGAALSLGTTGADAKGCIKGAIVGGAAGHLAHHGLLGAAAGCVVGHHMANKKAKADAAAASDPNAK